jgi:2-polyprenyl-3-methyl-5-hydroxy-6-metoxy-1,4-benzoquinol methylase
MNETSAHTSWLPYMTKTVNYNNWVFSMYKDFVGKRVLDIGSGYGTFISFISNREYVAAVEPSEECYKYLKAEFSKNKNIDIFKSDINAPELLSKVREKGIDTVICLNVLEHIEDDKKVVRNIHGILKPGGKFILFVPALNIIYGTLDEALGHYRRYDKKELELMLIEAGFKIVKSRYLNFTGAFSWFLYSRILKAKSPAEKRILFYDRFVVPIVSLIENLVSLPFGQSILIIAQS